MKDIVPTLQGMKTNITNLKQILFDYVKMEMLATIRPLSKILQEISLITCNFVTVCKVTFENVSRMRTILENKSQEAFRCETIFPKTNAFLSQLVVEHNEIIPEHRTRTNNNENGDIYVLYCEYVLNGDIDNSLNHVREIFVSILEDISAKLTTLFSSMLDDPVFIALATFLDTKSYQHKECNELFDSINLIYKCFQVLLGQWL